MTNGRLKVPADLAPTLPKGKPPHKGPPREPLRNLIELAEELGVTTSSLYHYMASRSDAPAPRIASGLSAYRVRNKLHYFSPSEVRAWWRNVIADNHRIKH